MLMIVQSDPMILNMSISVTLHFRSIYQIFKIINFQNSHFDFRPDAISKTRI